MVVAMAHADGQPCAADSSPFAILAMKPIGYEAARTLSAAVFALTLTACSAQPVPTAAPTITHNLAAATVELAPTGVSAERPTWTAVPALPGLLSSFPTAEAPQALILAPPPYPAPWAIQPNDHFYLRRPIPSDHAYRINSEYRYGNTDSGNEPTHTGVDLDAVPDAHSLGKSAVELGLEVRESESWEELFNRRE